jgi:hypothetical protein
MVTGSTPGTDGVVDVATPGVTCTVPGAGREGTAGVATPDGRSDAVTLPGTATVPTPGGRVLAVTVPGWAGGGGVAVPGVPVTVPDGAVPGVPTTVPVLGAVPGVPTTTPR